MSSDGARWHRRLHLPVDDIGELERTLWIVVALALVGDVATTFVGLHLGLSESNPIARGAIDGGGIVGMLALKAGAIGIGLGCRTLLSREYGPIVPAGLALPWLFATCVNLLAISTIV